MEWHLFGGADSGGCLGNFQKRSTLAAGVTAFPGVRAAARRETTTVFARHTIPTKDANPRAVAPDQIKSIRVLETWMNGHQVFAA